MKIHHPLGLLIGKSTTFFTLVPMHIAERDTERTLLVERKILLAYEVFVGFGRVLYLDRDQVDRFGERTWSYIGAGFVLSCGYLADASDWLYLVHLPLTIWLPGLMNGWNAHAGVKSSITLAGSPGAEGARSLPTGIAAGG